MIITADKLREAATKKGGYRKQQVEIGQKLSGCRKGWKVKLIGMNVYESDWDKFIAAGSSKKRKNKEKKKILNSVSAKHDGWAWKPEKKDIPEIKVTSGNKKNRGKKKQNRLKVSAQENKEFYLSREWRELRVRVLENYKCKCMMCGRSPKEHNIVIHVDHIKPRSKYPELSLDYNNLQLLCKDCNLGKSNKFETDWRPDLSIDEKLDMDCLANSPI